MMDDTKSTKPVIEKRREWEHGDEGRGKDCARAKKPVFTDPANIPGVCRDGWCDNHHWLGRGLVERDKASKKIMTRDGKKVEP